MILQLHWQFKDETTEMRAQKEFTFESYKSNQEYFDWIKDVQKNHPLPEGAVWLCCKEDSKYFAGVPIKEEMAT